MVKNIVKCEKMLMLKSLPAVKEDLELQGYPFLLSARLCRYGGKYDRHFKKNHYLYK